MFRPLVLSIREQTRHDAETQPFRRGLSEGSAGLRSYRSMAARHRNTHWCTRSDRAARPATLSGKYMKDLLDVAAAGVGGLLGRAPVFARVHIGGIPVPPVVRGVGLLVSVVTLRCLT
jgi:hypothetical protein